MHTHILLFIVVTHLPLKYVYSTYQSTKFSTKFSAGNRVITDLPINLVVML
jgi:hypothetical protein